jgi:DNA-binding FadR family transcriptional regulator
VLAAIQARDDEGARQAMLDHLIGVEALVVGREPTGAAAPPRQRD